MSALAKTAPVPAEDVSPELIFETINAFHRTAAIRRPSSSISSQRSPLATTRRPRSPQHRAPPNAASASSAISSRRSASSRSGRGATR